MRLLTLFITFLLSLAPLLAQNALGLHFGAPRAQAMQKIEAQFGRPDAADEEQCRYTDKTFLGIHFNKVVFGFDNGRLCEARFIKKQPDKRAARRGMEALHDSISQTTHTSMDLEDRWTPFYVGGISPNGIGHLFTLFISRYDGAWSTQLRYGPFRFKKEE